MKCDTLRIVDAIDSRVVITFNFELHDDITKITFTERDDPWEPMMLDYHASNRDMILLMKKLMEKFPLDAMGNL